MSVTTAASHPSELAFQRTISLVGATGIVLWREIRERKMVLWGALGIGIIFLLLPILPQLRSSAEAVWTVASMYVAVPTGMALALYGGASFVAAELKENRIAFFMSRPIPTLAIWGGKILAAITLGFAGMVLVLLPVTLAGNGLVWLLTDSDWGTPAILALVGIGITIGAPLAHAGGIALRSRSAWLLLDLTTLTVLGLVVWSSLQRLLLRNAIGLAGVVFLVTLGILIPVLALAGYRGFGAGRTDLRRTHAHQSVLAASGIALVVLGQLGYLSWAESASSEDVTGIRVAGCSGWECPPVLYGTTPGRGDLETLFVHWSGKTFKPGIAHGIATSQDGGRLAWIEPASLEPPEGTLIWSTGEGEAVHRTGIVVEPFFTTEIALSPDGKLFAAATENLLRLIVLDEERVLRSVKLATTPSWLRFVGPDRILAIGVEHGGNSSIRSTVIEAVSLDGKREEPVRLPGVIVGFDPSTQRLLIQNAGMVRVIDIENWEELLSKPADDALLVEGGLVLAHADPPSIEMVRPLESPSRMIRLPRSAADVALSWSDGTRVIVTTSEAGMIGTKTASELEVWELDFTTGETRALAAGLVPAREIDRAISGPFFIEPTEAGERLVHIDPSTREVSVIAGRR